MFFTNHSQHFYFHYFHVSSESSVICANPTVSQHPGQNMPESNPDSAVPVIAMLAQYPAVKAAKPLHHWDKGQGQGWQPPNDIVQGHWDVVLTQ